MIKRVLESEVMDSPTEAIDYDTMDHADVNRAFVADLLAAWRWHAAVTSSETNTVQRPTMRRPLGKVLDLGTGTAQIPIALCRADAKCHVTAIDLSLSMLGVGRQNVEHAELGGRIRLEPGDAKKLSYDVGAFSVVICNSIVHHVPEPLDVMREAMRVCARGGLLFFRDLVRPTDDVTLRQLVDTYAGDANGHQQQMFGDSLRAALTLEEVRDRVAALGLARDTVQQTSDRHWTWVAGK